MKNMSAKNKIYIAIFCWIVLCGSMFFYFFNILDASNALLVTRIGSQEKDLLQLQAEQKSFVKAKQDLEKVKKEPYQPADFFSQDITLVKEIQTFEDLATQTNVSIILSGVSGTFKILNKAKTQSSIYSVPFGLTITGSLPNDVAYLDGMEHLPFLNNVTGLTVGVGVKNTVSITVNGFLYIKQQH